MTTRKAEITFISAIVARSKYSTIAIAIFTVWYGEVDYADIGRICVRETCGHAIVIRFISVPERGFI